MVDRRVKPGQESAELLGQVARELSVLVRRDIEVAAVERLPILRRAYLDLAAVAAVVLAALLALAALTVAAGAVLAAVVPAWSAALVVAAAWALVFTVMAYVLRPRAQPREREELIGLIQFVSRKQGLEELHSSREEARDEADEEVRRTSAALVKALLDEVAEHQVKALPDVARQEIANAAEAATPDLLADALALLTAPARAGLSVLERLAVPPAVGSGSEERAKPRPDETQGRPRRYPP
jgi:hypothetical protein